MNVVIHVADGAVFRELDYADRIEASLTAAGLDVVRRDLTVWPPEPIPRARAHVFTGGETPVGSEAPWMAEAIRAVRDLVRTADAEGHMVIGVCLGSQIVAEALREGSIVESSSIEVGLVEVVQPHDGQARQVVPTFHYHSISPDLATVPGVRIEWGNEQTPVQAFSFGENVFCCQYHPELSADDVHQLIDQHAALISDLNCSPEKAHETVKKYSAELSDDLFRNTVVDRILA